MITPVRGQVQTRGRAQDPGWDAPWDDAHAGEAVVDLDAIAANAGVLVERVAAAGTGAAVMAVVKADAYGHGLVPSARAAVAGGASWLGVAQVGEALALRRAGLTVPVLAWLAVPGQDLAPAVAAGVDLSVSEPSGVAVLAEAAQRAGVPARVHLKVDTGLGRSGSPVAAWPDLVHAALAAAAAGTVQVVGAWSHLAFADAPGHPTVRAAEGVFADAVAVAEALGARFAVRHLANSAATLTRPQAHLDLVRPGIAVYGLSPGPQVGAAADLGLRPAMTLRARLALVKDVAAGQGVSYAQAYTTPTATRLALVPLGYADGVPRHAGGDDGAGGDPPHAGGPVAVAGGVTRVAGRVCMDQLVVDLAGLPGMAGAAAGDVAVLFGDGADGGPTAEDWARAAGTIGYEVVTRISSRLPRRWVGTAGRVPGGEA